MRFALWMLVLVACDDPVSATLPRPSEEALSSCPVSACGTACKAGHSCTLEGRCVEGAVHCVPPARELTDGWDDPPGTGVVFVIDELAIADRDRGFDLDGKCRGPGDCIDNSLFQLGQLANDQIRQALLGGETLLLLEIAGLDDTDFDASVTIKLYSGRDADDPFFPANNFSIPTGETRCCEFKIHSASLEQGQAIHRIPARIAHGYLRTIDVGTFPRTMLTDSSTDTGLALIAGLAPSVDLQRAQLSAFIPTNASELNDGLVGGVERMQDLAGAENPYCKTLNNLCQRQLPSSTMLDLVSSILPPDLDLDEDGLERTEAGPGGLIDRCFDGCCDGCELPPIDPANLGSCVFQPQMQDGYSVGITLSGVAAKVIGVGD